VYSDFDVEITLHKPIRDYFNEVEADVGNTCCIECGRLLSLNRQRQSSKQAVHLEECMHNELHVACLALVDARNNKEPPAKNMKVEGTLMPKSLQFAVPRING
jgi:hypothetical protein